MHYYALRIYQHYIYVPLVETPLSITCTVSVKADGLLRASCSFTTPVSSYTVLVVLTNLTETAIKCIAVIDYIFKSNDSNSLSSFTIVTLRIQCDCNNTPLGKEDEFINILNDSFVSNMLSFIIETLNEVLIYPAGMVTLNGPGS